jgi:hypothetical protein
MEVRRTVIGFQVEIDVVGVGSEEKRKVAREMVDHSLVGTAELYDVAIKIEKTGFHWPTGFLGQAGRTSTLQRL